MMTTGPFRRTAPERHYDLILNVG